MNLTLSLIYGDHHENNNLFVEKYGKFNQKEIEFKDRINLIYGRNEAGKSTLYNLIIALLYGFILQTEMITLMLAGMMTVLNLKQQ